MALFSPGYVSVFSVLGIVVMLGSSWRINRAGKGWREIEEVIGVYRARRAALQVQLVAAKMDEAKD